MDVGVDDIPEYAFDGCALSEVTFSDINGNSIRIPIGSH